MFSISNAAKQCKISRTTLLYYDEIGLLKPQFKNRMGYRFYSEQDIETLKQIVEYRKTGLSLNEIKTILLREGPEAGLVSIMMKRLGEINQEIQALKDQQALILRFMKTTALVQLAEELPHDEGSLVAILANAGIGEHDIAAWHRFFEASSPEIYREFDEAVKSFLQKIGYRGSRY